MFLSASRKGQNSANYVMTHVKVVIENNLINLIIVSEKNCRALQSKKALKGFVRHCNAVKIPFTLPFR